MVAARGRKGGRSSAEYKSRRRITISGKNRFAEERWKKLEGGRPLFSNNLPHRERRGGGGFADGAMPRRWWAPLYRVEAIHIYTSAQAANEKLGVSENLQGPPARVTGPFHCPREREGRGIVPTRTTDTITAINTGSL